MSDHLRAIEIQFQELAEHLAALIELYAEDPEAAHQIDRLRSAYDNAIRAVELVRDWQRSA